MHFYTSDYCSKLELLTWFRSKILVDVSIKTNGEFLGISFFNEFLIPKGIPSIRF